MDITKLLAELRAERQAIEAAIIAFEGFARGSGKRRGRPPKWMSETKQPKATAIEKPEIGPGKKRAVGAETRRKMAEAQKKRREAAKAGEPQ